MEHSDMPETNVLFLKGEEIYKIIPNRYPLMILDSLEIIPGESAIGRKILVEDDWFFTCHFPNKPIFPGCLLIETLTQVFISIFLALEKQMQKKEIPLLIKLGEFSIKAGATIGDRLRFEAHLDSFRRGMAKGYGKAYKENYEEEDELMTEFSIIEIIPSMIAVPKI